MRRIGHSRGLVKAMEEEQVIEAAVAAAAEEPPVEPAPVVAEPDPVEQLDNAESLETELLDVQDVVEEGTEQEAQVEEAGEVVEALDEYQEALESIAAQGGLDRNGARIFYIGMEQLCGRVGVEMKSVSMPSMESFGGSSTRIKATQLAMESVKETAKAVWDAILKAIGEAGKWLKNFFAKLVDANVRLKARAEKTAAAAKSVKGEASGEIENAGLVAKLAIDGKVEAGWWQKFDSFVKFVEAMSGKVVPAVVAYSKEVVDSIPKSVNDQGQEDIVFKAAGAKAAFSGLQLSAAEGEATEGLETLKSAQLPGGKALVVQLPTADGVEGAKAFAKARTGFDYFKPALAKPSTDKLPVMKGDEALAIAEDVVRVTGSIETLRGLEKEFDAFLKSLTAGAQTFAKAQELANDPGNAKAVAAKKKLLAARAVYTSLTHRVSNIPATVGSYALSTSKAALDYAELSLKAHKAPAAA